MNLVRNRKFKTEYGAELLRIAAGDLASAHALQESKKGRKENIGYFAQQCIEKSLKAVLCFKGIPVPQTCELAALIPLIDASLNCPFGLEISDLSYFATIRRYMEGNYEIEDDEIDVSLEVGEKILAWASGIVT